MPRHTVFAAIDRRIEIDQMNSRAAGAHQVYRHITVGVKPASISQHSVVISHSQCVIELGPADALDLYCEDFPDLHPPRRNFHQALFEVIRRFGEHTVLSGNPYYVPAAEVVRHRDGLFQRSTGCRPSFPNRHISEVPSTWSHTVAARCNEVKV